MEKDVKYHPTCEPCSWKTRLCTWCSIGKCPNIKQPVISAYKGTIVLCEDGHEVAEIMSNIYKGEINYRTKISNYRPGQTIPAKGDPLPLKCYCGADWFRGHSLVNTK